MSETTLDIAPFRSNRQLLALLASRSIGMAACGIYFVGLPLLVLERMGSALSICISLLLGLVPFAIAA